MIESVSTHFQTCMCMCNLRSIKCSQAWHGMAERHGVAQRLAQAEMPGMWGIRLGQQRHNLIARLVHNPLRGGEGRGGEGKGGGAEGKGRGGGEGRGSRGERKGRRSGGRKRKFDKASSIFILYC